MRDRDRDRAEVHESPEKAITVLGTGHELDYYSAPYLHSSARVRQLNQ